MNALMGHNSGAFSGPCTRAPRSAAGQRQPRPCTALPTVQQQRQQHQQQPVAPQLSHSRRQLLSGASAAALLANAFTLPPGALAVQDASRKVCVEAETAELGRECRLGVLDKDASSQDSYDSITGQGRKLGTAGGTPVSVIDDEYSRATRALNEELRSYMTLDVYDKARLPLVKSVKTDCVAWVSKYARGGNVRKQSARMFYIAADSVMGHLASNGLAPFPQSKAKTVTARLDESLAFLADGK